MPVQPQAAASTHGHPRCHRRQLPPVHTTRTHAPPPPPRPRRPSRRSCWHMQRLRRPMPLRWVWQPHQQRQAVVTTRMRQWRAHWHRRHRCRHQGRCAMRTMLQPAVVTTTPPPLAVACPLTPPCSLTPPPLPCLVSCRPTSRKQRRRSERHCSPVQYRLPPLAAAVVPPAPPATTPAGRRRQRPQGVVAGAGASQVMVPCSGSPPMCSTTPLARAWLAASTRAAHGVASPTALALASTLAASCGKAVGLRGGNTGWASCPTATTSSCTRGKRRSASCRALARTTLATATHTRGSGWGDSSTAAASTPAAGTQPPPQCPLARAAARRSRLRRVLPLMGAWAVVVPPMLRL